MSKQVNWQPTADIQALKKRAEILRQIRDFFYHRQVMEVETPMLSSGTVTDLHLEGFATKLAYPCTDMKGDTLYLQTSPEFAMKRLLAAGSGCIFQLAKAFRNEQAGRFHNPEFTMLEWYRIGFDHFALMAEIDQLMQYLLDCEPADKMSYQQAFKHYVGLDPLTANIEQLQQAVLDHQLHADWVASESNIDTLLQFLFGELVERNIGKSRPCFIYHFPSSQASLAKIHAEDQRVAERFELYYQGVELANGFHELTDANEQYQRFQADNKLRTEYNLAEKPIDQHFIKALQSGLPDCSGVALGIDRVVMIALNAEHIKDVIAFPVNIA
ncbi:elongation factor P--(R)-beta-lysine ligase [Thalassotalea aquiviva]|uniref:elongation factor P--(R)-beta-lysine ligase n=1 Tax=Thalassotalea aquiviva TaxID=3242415 RepID=UPI00352A10F7